MVTENDYNKILIKEKIQNFLGKDESKNDKNKGMKWTYTIMSDNVF